MRFTPEFETISLNQVTMLAAKRKSENWRFVQLLAVNTDSGVDILYSFMDMQTGALVNSKVKGLTKEDRVPSITDKFLEAFVFENEIHDLFGIEFDNIAIDFKGNFYRVSIDEPMTVISPEQKAAKEKAAKIAAAKAAKEAKASKAGPSEDNGTAAPDAAAAEKALDDMEEKLKAMDPEKAAKVRAAIEAKAKLAAENNGEGE